MPNDNRSLLARGLATFTGPMNARMSARKKKMEALGTDKTGGMFDIIYRKKREREKAAREAYGE